MTTFSNFHVIYLNPEEMTKAKFRIFLRFNSNAFEETVQINDICGEIANIAFNAKYTNDNVYRLYANVSGKTNDEAYGHSFKFASDFDDDTKPILNTKSGWQLIGRKSRSSSSHHFVYNMTIELISEGTAPFKELYTDLDLTDFELRGEGLASAVRVHRSVLAVSSPILKSMVQLNWNEAKQGHVTVPDVSTATLEHFKKYLYLKELPDSPMDCAKLLPMIYLMPELGIKCTIKIVDIVKPADGWEWLEYFVSNAVAHKAYILLAALFKNMSNDNIKALEDHFSKLSISK